MISIIIATSGRVEKLRRLLDGLSRTEGSDRIPHEVVVANNAGGEAAAVADLVARYGGSAAAVYRQIREPVPGKCRAQNGAIRGTQGSILAFLDDDLEVAPGWLQAIEQFFKSYPHDAMQGSILMHSGDRANAEIQRALERYRTVDFIDYGFAPGTEIGTLTGGNIAVKRDVFDRVGLFNEKLGPGEAGISEDVEFAKRMLSAGKRIGYEPRAIVYNELDSTRLTEEFFRLRHEQQGRSRLIYKQSSFFSIVPNLLRSLWTFGWYSLVGPERKKYRAKGRYYHYGAMLREKVKRSRARAL